MSDTKEIATFISFGLASRFARDVSSILGEDVLISRNGASWCVEASSIFARKLAEQSFLGAGGAKRESPSYERDSDLNHGVRMELVRSFLALPESYSEKECLLKAIQVQKDLAKVEMDRSESRCAISYSNRDDSEEYRSEVHFYKEFREYEAKFENWVAIYREVESIRFFEAGGVDFRASSSLDRVHEIICKNLVRYAAHSDKYLHGAFEWLAEKECEVRKYKEEMDVPLYEDEDDDLDRMEDEVEIARANVKSIALISPYCWIALMRFCSLIDAGNFIPPQLLRFIKAANREGFVREQLALEISEDCEIQEALDDADPDCEGL